MEQSRGNRAPFTGSEHPGWSGLATPFAVTKDGRLVRSSMSTAEVEATSGVAYDAQEFEAFVHRISEKTFADPHVSVVLEALDTLSKSAISVGAKVVMIED
jgi:hypothetical protein